MLVVHWRALNTVGIDSLCCSDLFFWVWTSVYMFTHRIFIHSFHLIAEVIDFCSSLDWCALFVMQEQFMNVHRFYFWISVWLKRAVNACAFLAIRSVCARSFYRFLYLFSPSTLELSVWLPPSSHFAALMRGVDELAKLWLQFLINESLGSGNGHQQV